MTNPIALENDVQLAQRIAQVPADLRAALARAAIQSQQTKERWPYYSRIRLQAGISVDDATVTYTVQRNTKVHAFSYAVGEPMLDAGFPQGRNATLADTNLNRARSTLDGEHVYIYGISAYLMPFSDPILSAAIFNESFVQFEKQGGDQRYKIGKLDMIPQPGGIFGVGSTILRTPPLNASDSLTGFPTNGNPQSANYLALPEPILWSEIGSTDGSLTMPVEVMQQIQMSATVRVAASGVAPYTPPAGAGQPGTYVDLMMFLHVRAEAARSKNR